MYNEEYENEQEEKTSENFLVNFYYNNKVLIWILCGVIIFILLMSLLTRGGSGGSDKGNYAVKILPEEEIVIAIGKGTKLTATVEGNSKAIVEWSSEDESIAKVEDGTVTALNYGKTKIYATYVHTNNEKYTGEKVITVADGDASLKLTDVSFQSGDLLMPLNSTYDIILNLTPTRGYITNKVFKSSKESVVKVDNNGEVTSVGEGEATITLDVNDGEFKKELKVYVSKDYTSSQMIVTPERIDFDGKVLKMKIGTTEKLKYSVFPTDASTSKLIWTSSDDSIVEISQKGYAKALKAGNATITLKAVNGVNATYDIEVETDIVPVTSIDVSTSNIYLTVGQSQEITPVVSPADASNKSLSFMTGDSNVAVVAPNTTNTSATVYGLREGTTTLTISSGKIEKRVSITVTGSSTPGTTPGSSGGGSVDQATARGFTISSSDANGGKFIVDSYPAENNVAVAPVQVTVTITNSSIAKVRVAKCKYPLTTCDPSASGASEITGSGTFTMNTAGVYLLRFAKYNSSGTQTGVYDKYISISGGSSSSSSEPYITCNSVKVGEIKECIVHNGYLQGGVSFDNRSIVSLYSTRTTSFFIKGINKGTTKGRATVNGTSVVFDIEVVEAGSGTTKCDTPKLTIGTDGKITFTKSSNCSTETHKACINGVCYSVSNASDIHDDLTQSTGSKTIYVKAIGTGSHTDSDQSASITTYVYEVKLDKSTGVTGVTGGGKYIKGEKAKINATLQGGCSFDAWYTSGHILYNSKIDPEISVTSKMSLVAFGNCPGGGSVMECDSERTPSETSVSESTCNITCGTSSIFSSYAKLKETAEASGKTNFCGCVLQPPALDRYSLYKCKKK